MNEPAIIETNQAVDDGISWSADTVGLLDALPVAIIILNAYGRVQWINRTAESQVGNLTRGALWREVVREIISEQPGGGLRLANGRYISVSTSPLKLQPGQIVVLNDVTENRRLQEAISQHRRLSAMGELAARLAHQIRTPLATVTLYLSQLSKLPDEQAQGNTGVVNKCLERVKHLNSIISDMLRLARGGTHDTETLSVSELLNEIEEQVSPALDKAKTHLQLVNQAEQSYIRGNRTLLIGMFENLIVNGLQAADGNARLRISAYAKSNDTVTISVEDNGHGIALANREQIFEPFFTTRSQGTGLGLAVVRSIANDHRAQITVHSVPDSGTRFDITFHSTTPSRVSTLTHSPTSGLLASGSTP